MDSSAARMAPEVLRPAENAGLRMTEVCVDLEQLSQFQFLRQQPGFLAVNHAVDREQRPQYEIPPSGPTGIFVRKREGYGGDQCHERGLLNLSPCLQHFYRIQFQFVPQLVSMRVHQCEQQKDSGESYSVHA